MYLMLKITLISLIAGILLSGCYMGALETTNDVLGVLLVGKSISDSSIYSNFMCGTIRNTTRDPITVRWHDRRLSKTTDLYLLPGESRIITFMIGDVFSLLCNGEELLGFVPKITRGR